MQGGSSPIARVEPEVHLSVHPVRLKNSLRTLPRFPAYTHAI